MTTAALGDWADITQTLEMDAGSDGDTEAQKCQTCAEDALPNAGYCMACMKKISKKRKKGSDTSNKKKKKKAKAS